MLSIWWWGSSIWARLPAVTTKISTWSDFARCASESDFLTQWARLKKKTSNDQRKVQVLLEWNKRRYEASKNQSVNHAAAPFMETGICFQESGVRKDEIFIAGVISSPSCCTLSTFWLKPERNTQHSGASHFLLDTSFIRLHWRRTWIFFFFCCKLFSDFCIHQVLEVPKIQDWNVDGCSEQLRSLLMLPQTFSADAPSGLLQLEPKVFHKLENWSVSFPTWPRIAGRGGDQDCEGSAPHVLS